MQRVKQSIHCWLLYKNCFYTKTALTTIPLTASIQKLLQQQFHHQCQLPVIHVSRVYSTSFLLRLHILTDSFFKPGYLSFFLHELVLLISWFEYFALSFANTINVHESPWPLSPLFYICLILHVLYFFPSLHYTLVPSVI